MRYSWPLQAKKKNLSARPELVVTILATSYNRLHLPPRGWIKLVVWRGCGWVDICLLAFFFIPRCLLETISENGPPMWLQFADLVEYQ